MNQLYRNLVITLTLVVSSAAANATTEFSRIDTNSDGSVRSLQIAVVSYERDGDEGGPRVDLVGAVHIGDQAYYQALNELFTSYDALLYELVAPEGTRLRRGESTGGGLSSGQRGLAKAMDLSFQLQEIDYTPTNFVHADLSPKGMLAAMEERNESLYSYFWSAIYAGMRQTAKDPLGHKEMAKIGKVLAADEGNKLKLLMAYEFADLGTLEDMFGKDSGTALIGARNQRAVEVLQRELDKGAASVGVFYGAAHMADLEKRLVDLGFKPVATRWFDAWLL